jgi:hypothetical protein
MRCLVDLRSNRRLLGTVHIQEDNFNIVCGPFLINGSADRKSAEEAGNPSMDPLLPFGHTPTGDYHIKALIGPDMIRDSDSYGPKALLLEAVSGQASEAEGNGRGLVAIHGGSTSAEGMLLPTNGSLRMFNNDIEFLFSCISAFAQSSPAIALPDLWR